MVTQSFNLKLSNVVYKCPRCNRDTVEFVPIGIDLIPKIYDKVRRDCIEEGLISSLNQSDKKLDLIIGWETFILMLEYVLLNYGTLNI